MLELDPRVVCCELPVDAGRAGVALFFPGCHCVGQGLLVGYAAVGALATQDAELALGDVEPAPMLGRVMDLQAVPDALGVRVVLVHQFADEMRPVNLGTALGDREVAPAALRLAGRAA